MKLHLAPSILSLLIFSLSCASSGSKENSELRLFAEGSNDWEIGGNAKWIFEDGVLMGQLDSGAGFVVTKEEFEDFELTLEFKPDSMINSGVYLRCADQALSATLCYEINIWDLHPNQEYRTGAVVTRASPLKYVETLNRWNTYRIRCSGNQIKAWINGELTVDLINEELPKGYIALQAAGGGTISFRKVRLTVVEEEPK